MNRRGQSGFTLIELLVGLTLLGLTVAMIVAALNTGLIGAGATGKRSERLNQIRASQAVLRRTLESARHVVWSGATRNRMAFDGEAEAIAFVALLPPWPGQGGPHLVRIAREADRLMLISRIYSGEKPGFDFSEPAGRTVLARNVRAVRFSYFGTADPRESSKWHDAWQARQSLPALVRLRVEFAGDAGTAWPAFVVAPVIGPQPR